jgi:ABC-type oligopeptide transport system substrate-binding subunit/class 3 adenylate cyclase
VTETIPTGTAELREERKVVSALFADLVGSTALAERLEAEEVRLVVGEAVARIVAEVEKLGGHVKDLAGDGVLAFFGAPVSYEDDAERAVRAALAIVDELRAYGADVARGWGVDGFAVRVGIATGPVVLGTVGAGTRVEYGAFGDTVNTAARLQAAADPGAVLVDRGTHRLVEPLFDWSEPRQLALKGKQKPTPAFAPRAARPVTGKPRGLEGVQTRLVGRERELAEGREAVEGVLSGAGGILFVTGEAGIGKSRLLLELRDAFESVPSQGGSPLWLEGRCVSYGDSLPYWPFRDLIREWLGAGPDEPELRVRVALRRKLGDLFEDRTDEIYPYLGTLLGLALEPDASARLAELAPEALQYRTFEVGRTMLERLAADGPTVVAMEDLHWADATSVQLLEQLLPTAEGAPVLFLLSQRNERDHPSWQLKEAAAREFPHLLREVPLEPLSEDADRELLQALVGQGTLPEALERRVLEEAEGNPFYLEELVRSLADVGVLAQVDDGWRFEREVPIEIPATVEKVILARIDRLSGECHDVLTAASALGRRFPLSLLEGVLDTDGPLREALHDLQRLDLIREGRRWPEPEYRFKHALIQEAAYRTLLSGPRTRLHRRAAEWLQQRYEDNEEEVLGLLAHHWLAADDDEKAVGYLTRAGDRARQEYALDEAIEHYRELLPLLERRGERREIALVLFKLALALHTSLRFSEANLAYQRAFEHWTLPAPSTGPATATLRMASSYVPSNPDPSRAGWWPDIQLCMQLFDRLVEAGPERTILPSLAERWEISDDGLRYVFQLREGTKWSDGTRLTAHDVEFGIKRVLDPTDSGASVSIYFVLENGQDYYRELSRDADRIGVKALDDRTVEFRLVAPAPYFMSVVNRPDAGPQPRHAVERDGPAWTRPEHQVVSGPFRQLERSAERLVLARNEWYAGVRSGNVGRVEYLRADADQALGPFERDELDAIRVMYTPRTADHVRALAKGEGPLTWTAYLGFDHAHPLVSNVELRRALAWAIDREALAPTAPVNFVVATGGVVPPALHGHTPEISPRLDRDKAREHLRRAEVEPRTAFAIAAQDAWAPMLEVLAAGWRETLELDVSLRLWSVEDVPTLGRPLDLAPAAVFGWLPGYPDPEYMLRLLLHSDAKTNEGGFAYQPFDDLVERARQERNDRERLELYHEADRMAVADQVALIPLVYGRSMALVKPRVKGWWEFAKSSASYADLAVEQD